MQLFSKESSYLKSGMRKQSLSCYEKYSTALLRVFYTFSWFNTLVTDVFRISLNIPTRLSYKLSADQYCWVLFLQRSINNKMTKPLSYAESCVLGSQLCWTFTELTQHNTSLFHTGIVLYVCELICKQNIIYP